MLDSEEIQKIKDIQENQGSKYTKDSSIQTVKMADYKTPIFRERKFKEWINCGPDNLWPLYLLRIMNNCAMHKRIIDSKVKQVAGEGLTVQDSEDKDQLAQMNEFLKKIKFNRKTLKKVAYDQQIFGYWFLGITWNSTRTKIANIYHVDASSIRVGTPDPDTKQITCFYYSEDWTQYRKQDFQPEKIAMFDPNNRVDENCLIMVREYQPATRFYALPSYEGCRDSIELSYELGSYMLNSIKNGLSPSLNISFNNGEPTEEERETIYRTVNSLYKGSSNAGKFILSFNKSKENATTIEPIQVSNMSEIYSKLDEYASNQIIVGHGLPSPALGGVAIPGQLGGISGEIEVASELFFNQVIAPSQLQIEEVMQELLEVNGFDLKVWIKDSQPVSFQYDDTTLMSIMTIDEMRLRINLPALSDFDKKNLAINITNPQGLISQTEQKTVQPAATEGMSNEIPINENIKNLSAKQHQQMLRIIRQYNKEQITKQTATILLKTGLGLSDEDINAMLDGAEEDMSIEAPNIAPYIKEVDDKKKKY